MDTKQVIIIRRDLKMRRGKEIAQACHASMAFITRRMHPDAWASDFLNQNQYTTYFLNPEVEWLGDSFKKICLQVNSEEELIEIEREAKAANIECHIVVDNGLTEFHGVPTKTCIALGPDYDEKIDKITGHLRLY